jgi:hypothetical protein
MFDKQAARTPTAIGDLSIQLFSPDPTGTEQASASFSLQVKFNDGSLRIMTGDLQPHLSQAQITQLQSFMTTLRSKAVAEVLP